MRWQSAWRKKIKHGLHTRYSKPWELQANGDIWRKTEKIIEERGPGTTKVTKLKGHAEQHHVDDKIITAENKAGNETADRLAGEAHTTAGTAGTWLRCWFWLGRLWAACSAVDTALDASGAGAVASHRRLTPSARILPVVKNKPIITNGNASVPSLSVPRANSSSKNWTIKTEEGDSRRVNAEIWVFEEAEVSPSRKDPRLAGRHRFTELRARRGGKPPRGGHPWRSCR